MGLYAAIMTGQKVLESFVDRFLPSLGFASIQPKRVTPVYFPAWIIDGEIHSPAKLASGKVTIPSYLIYYTITDLL